MASLIFCFFSSAERPRFFAMLLLRFEFKNCDGEEIAAKVKTLESGR